MNRNLVLLKQITLQIDEYFQDKFDILNGCCYTEQFNAYGPVTSKNQYNRLNVYSLEHNKCKFREISESILVFGQTYLTLAYLQLNVKSVIQTQIPSGCMSQGSETVLWVSL